MNTTTTTSYRHFSQRDLAITLIAFNLVLFGVSLAQSCDFFSLLNRPRHVMATVEAIVKEASRVPLYLPNVSALKEALRKAREWSDKVDQVQVR